jgi:hypothetical protein
VNIPARARRQAVQRLPLTISEADFQRTVIQTAMVYGWRVSHQRPAQVRTGRWATSITGHPGLPDLVLARDGVVLLCELKRHGGRPTPGQVAWLAALGGHGRLWSPLDWPAVVAELRGPMGGAA